MRQPHPHEERSSRRASSRASFGSLASQSSSASSGGWPAWVLDAERDTDRGRDSDRVAATQAVHTDREVVKARQARLREAVVQGDRRAVTAALRHHPDDVHGKDDRDRSSFWLAVLAGRAEMVELLANAGVLIEEQKLFLTL